MVCFRLSTAFEKVLDVSVSVLLKSARSWAFEVSNSSLLILSLKSAAHGRNSTREPVLKGRRSVLSTPRSTVRESEERAVTLTISRLFCSSISVA